MTASKEYLLDRVTTIVRQAMPNLKINTFEVNQDGLINDVVIVNDNFVFRFAKTAANAAILATETHVLDIIRPRIGVNVPNPIFKSVDCIVYPYLPGQPLLREMIVSSDQKTQQRIADELGQFLYMLHTTPILETSWHIPQTRAPLTRERHLLMRQRVEEKIYPLLLKHQIQWANNLFNEILNNPKLYQYKPALVHADLAPYHILYSKNDKK